MLRIATTIFLLTCLMSVSHAQAPQVWSLGQCLQRAQEQNIELKQAELNMNTSEIALARAKAQRLPSINMGGNYGGRLGLSEDPITNQLLNKAIQNVDMGVSSSVDLFSGGLIHNSIRQSRIDLKVQESALAQQELELALEVTLAYVSILQRKEILESAVLQLNSTKKQRDQSRKMIKAGTAAKEDLLQLESQIATEEVNVVNAQSDLDLGYLLLQQLLNLPPSKDFEIIMPDLPDPEDDFSQFNVEEIYAYAEANQPIIRSAILQTESAKLGVNIAKSRRIPVLSLLASYGTGYSSFAQEINGDKLGRQFNLNRRGSLNLILFFPIYNKRETRSEIELAENSLQDAQYNAQVIRQDLRQLIEQAYLDAKNEYIRYRSTQKQVAALEATFANTERRFNLGAANSIDYLLAKNTLNSAYYDLLRTKYTYIFRQKVLNFYLGNPIGFED